MRIHFDEIRNKEVISIKDGTRYGCVEDLIVETDDACIIALIIPGRLKWFGLFGRCPDIVVSWKDIEVIGKDTILVNGNVEHDKRRAKRKKLF